jgi:dinuclear metal center YbgI/SA1388 family protein
MKQPQCFVSDLVRAVEAIAPARLAESWDAVGLQVGHHAAPVRRVLTCLEVTPPTLNEAVRLKADAIVAHHPLIFQPLAALNLAQPAPELIARLLREGIALVVAHTNLDAAAWGTNSVLAEACGLRPEGPLLPRETDPENPLSALTGLGCRATLEAPLLAEALAVQLKERLGLAAVRLSGPPQKKVRRVAVCSGSGGSFIGKVAGRADAYITGEINYHHAVEAHARGIAVIELGHFESEALIAEPLARRLAAAEKLAAAQVEVIAAQSDLQPFLHL